MEERKNEDILSSGSRGSLLQTFVLRLSKQQRWPVTSSSEKCMVVIFVFGLAWLPAIDMGYSSGSSNSSIKGSISSSKGGSSSRTVVAVVKVVVVVVAVGMIWG